MSAGNRPDGKIQRNSVRVTVSKGQTSSPSYHLRISRDGDILKEIGGRFAIYRDLYTLINADKSCERLLKKKFPPTLAKSSIGVKMSVEEVEQRRELLDDWVRDVFNHFNDFPPPSRASIAKFVQLPEADVELVDEPEPEPVAAPAKEAEGKQRSMKGVISAIKRTVSSKSGSLPDADSTTSSLRGLGSVSGAGPDAAPYQMTAYVSRGSSTGGHQTYETNIKYSAKERRMIVSKEFKEYRALMRALAAHGIRHKHYKDAQEAGEEDIEEVEFSKVIDIPSAFPRTYKRSTVGVPLSEEALAERCVMLDRWIKDVLSLYFTFEPKAKAVVNRFLGYSDEYENELVEHVVEMLNRPNSVVGNPPVNKDEAPQLEPRADTVYVKAVRRDTLVQSNVVSVTQAPDNGHPVYTLQVLRHGMLLTEVKGQFALFREFHAKLNAQNYINDVLTAPFPATKRRSSLGIKLTDDMVEVRKTELNTWWIDLLDHFTDVTDEVKGFVSEFLSISKSDLELIDSSGTGPSPAPLVVSPEEPEGKAVDYVIEEQPIAQPAGGLEGKVQRNSVLVTQAPENGHPLYTLKVIKSVEVLGEVKGQFAIFRDLYTKINDDKFCDNLLTTPFPATKRRSSLGIKLTNDLVDARRQELNEWWTNLLNCFDDLKLERQLLVADFLGMTVSDLELIDPASPKVANQATGKKSSLVTVFQDIDDEEVDTDGGVDLDNVEPEWQEIPAAKKPSGCCVIS